jgi:hypothetical protein
VSANGPPTAGRASPAWHRRIRPCSASTLVAPPRHSLQIDARVPRLPSSRAAPVADTGARRHCLPAGRCVEPSQAR